MKLLDNLKQEAEKLKLQLSVMYCAYKNPKTGTLPKILIMLTLAYAMSPVDLIPDFIPVLGLLDDLIIIPALISLSVSLIPKEVMDEAKKTSQLSPVKLRNNWVFASVFIMAWTLLLYMIVKTILRLLSLL